MSKDVVDMVLRMLYITEGLNIERQEANYHKSPNAVSFTT